MGPKKEKAKVVIDGVDTSAMTREKLEKFALALRNELEREREERNFFQLERDKLRTFWEISLQQLAELRNSNRNKDREAEIKQEFADQDEKEIVQEMKYLQYEHRVNMGELRAEMDTALKKAQEDHLLQERNLLNDKAILKQKLREKGEHFEWQIQELKLQHDESLNLQRTRFRNKIEAATQLFEERLLSFKEEAEVHQKMELSELEERKNCQLDELINDSEKAYSEMKMYYNDITLDNLAVIDTLATRMEGLLSQAQNNLKNYNEISEENKNLVEPLSTMKMELKKLRNKLYNYDRDKSKFEVVKRQLQCCNKKLANIQLEEDILEARCEILLAERDSLLDRIEHRSTTEHV